MNAEIVQLAQDSSRWKSGRNQTACPCCLGLTSLKHLPARTCWLPVSLLVQNWLRDLDLQLAYLSFCVLFSRVAWLVNESGCIDIILCGVTFCLFFLRIMFPLTLTAYDSTTVPSRPRAGLCHYRPLIGSHACESNATISVLLRRLEMPIIVFGIFWLRRRGSYYPHLGFVLIETVQV